MSTFLTQKGNLGIKKLSDEEVAESIPLPINRQSQVTDLVEARKVMDEVQELLRMKQAEYRERMEACDKREAALNAKQEKTREQVARFALFMKENDAKRNRATKRAQDERRQRLEKEEEIERLKTELAQTQARCTRLSKHAEDYSIFQLFLERVVEVSDEFTECDDVLRRYATLVATNGDLASAVTANTDEAENLRTSLNDTYKSMHNEILVLSSESAVYREKLDRLRQQGALEERQAMHREAELKDKIRVIGEAKMAISNLYSRCIATKKKSRAEATIKVSPDVVQGLRRIQHRFVEVQGVAQLATAITQAAAEAKLEREKEKPKPAAGGATQAVVQQRSGSKSPTNANKGKAKNQTANIGNPSAGKSVRSSRASGFGAGPAALQ